MGDAEALRAAACCGEKGLLSCIDLASLLQGTSAAVGADDACASPAACMAACLAAASGDVAVLPLASAAALGDGGEALAGLSPQLAGIESPSFTWIQLDDEEGLPALADPCRPAAAAGDDSPLRCWASAAPASEPLLLQKRLGQVSKLRSLCDARTQITSHSLTSRRRFQTETSQATAT